MGSLLSANVTIARNLSLIQHFSRQNVVYCSFSKQERVFPDWSYLFGSFLGYFQRRNAIFGDFEERNTASVDVWVIFGSFSNEERHDLAKPRASSIYILIQQYKGRQGLAHSPHPEPTAHSQQPTARRAFIPPLFWRPFSAHF